MLELVETRVFALGCFAAPEAADALMRAPGAYACRVAPDEVLLIAEPGASEDLARASAETATAADPDAAVLDTTDGWAVWTLEGSDAREAFARLSAVPLPEEGFTQGDVAHVPAKVVVSKGRERLRLHLLVPAMWSAFLRERILHDCASLGVRRRAEPAPWTPPAGGRRRK